MLGALPAVLLVGLLILQVLAVGHAAVLAGNAAEAGALALAAGGDARVEARRALPDWSRAHVRVEVGPDRVEVGLRPASLFSSLARRLAVNAEASVAG